MGYTIISYILQGGVLMKDLDVKIHYLYNSGFTVETKNHFAIFDYYKDSVDTCVKNISNGAIGEEDITIYKEKDILVFSSHSHADHFNPVVLNWANLRPDIQYIFSDDIKTNSNNKNINKISAYEELNLKDVYIRSYGSTDMGVSFLVKLDGITIFHAGDLNWWYWRADTSAEIQKAEVWFKEEIQRIEGENIDIAFFPVDPRLEQNYYVGGEYFIKELNPKYLIPMHFGQNFEITKEFANRVKGYETKVLEITHRGQELII